MTLTGSITRRSLELDRPFTISRGTTTTTENVIVRLEDDNETVGIGGAAPSTHYGETADTVEAVLPSLLDAIETMPRPESLARIEETLLETVRRNPAARAAISIAAHDLVAKRQEMPLYALWGEDPSQSIATSYTIGIDDPESMASVATSAVEAGHDILKVKLGTEADRERLEAVRSAAPGARIRVDANEAWGATEAVRKSAWLADADVEFVEQPVPATDREGLRYVYEQSAIPVAVDESVEVASDVPRVADRTDIVVLKLMKCGGLREARKFIHTARAHDLEVMCGCMVESNASIAAACHLAPLLDYADLDGSLLLAADPFAGVPLEGGYIDLTALERPGTGTRER